MARPKKTAAVAPPPVTVAKKDKISSKTKDIVEMAPVDQSQQKVVESNLNVTNDAEPLCGVCGKVVGGDISQHYFASCNVCGKRYSIHSKRNCARKLWMQTTLGKVDDVPSREVPRDVFNGQISVGLYCFGCKVPCFYCAKGTHHVSGKRYINGIVYVIVYDILLILKTFFLIVHRSIRH